MSGSEGNSKLCFPELRAQDSRKTKLTGFLSQMPNKQLKKHKNVFSRLFILS